MTESESLLRASEEEVALVVWGERLWRERLQFRDALRADPALARRYAELKRSLVDRHRRDREAYTAAKGDFVHAILHGSPPPSAQASCGD
ncbi:GrpB family protein [Halomonas sp. EGI 63088]|uniref:GrpB family protein n=1 Tax=Halomonas flagellata TaxID=2920385 RepID=A0ABS9RWC0_9GAMM|nr:GrpB family protein [Halomonas flagellata]